MFQSRGPAGANDRSPTVTHRDGRTSRRLEVDERRRPQCRTLPFARFTDFALPTFYLPVANELCFRNILVACCAGGLGNSSNIETVRRHYLYLVENLDLRFLGLLDRLYTDNVVDLQEMEDIGVQQTSVRQNEKLLCLLSRKSAEQFQTFLQDLDKSGQSHIRKRLDNKQGFLLNLLLHSVFSSSVTRVRSLRCELVRRLRANAVGN